MPYRPPLVPVTITLVGAYLAWFGVHYWRSTVAWPSDPIKDILTGKGLPPATKEQPSQQLASLTPGGSPSMGAPGATGPVGSMPAQSTYTQSQLQLLWTTSGGSPAAAQIAAAIAMAESSGNPSSTSSNPDGGTNVGLWQLDTKGVGAGYSIDQLKEPDTNCRVTIMGSLNGTNWGDWETYANGSYKRFLGGL